MAMTKEPVQAAKGMPLEPLPKVDTYGQWQRSEGVPVVRGFYIEDLTTLELGTWERKGGRGAIVNLEGTGGVNDMHVVEIAPGGQSAPESHLYDETVYILSGRGSTSVWNEGGPKVTFEWGPGSLFAIPLNARYQHFNASGQTPARYASVTNAPTVLSLFHNNDFVFNNPYPFHDRFAGKDNYFNGDGKMYTRRVWETNFVPDTRRIQLHSWKERGAGGTNIMLELSQSSMGAHISRFDVGTYKKAHRHGPGAHVIILDGVGFSLLWKDGDEQRKKCPWKPGSVVVPPAEWFHQHFNTGAEPAKYLAVRFSALKYRQPTTPSGSGEGADVSVKQGGWQIEYEDEDPQIHQEFEAELARHGATCRMLGQVPGCTGIEGPVVRGGGD